MGTQSATRAARLAALIPKSVALPRGFSLAGVATGVKKAKGGNRDPPLDLTLVHSKAPCTAAATFTQNLFQAAPVRVSRALLDERGGQGFHAVVVNSGCANACTGTEGDKNARAMADAAAEAVGAPKGTALVMSTGVIGVHLQMEKIREGVKRAAGALNTRQQDVEAAARAIMTTDTFPKYLSRERQLPESKVAYTLAGMCKGAGMIHPNMICHRPSNQGTMLGVLMTDLPLAAPAAADALDLAVRDSFNAVTIDGDTSTNDTVILLANGQAATKGPGPAHLSRADMQAFTTELRDFSRDLASRLVWDGEGATKFISVQVQSHAHDVSKAIAGSIAQSALVKTALYGQDANWGRILCAVGYTTLPAAERAKLRPETVSLRVRSQGGEIHLVDKGRPLVPIDEEKAAAILKCDEIDIQVDMGTGKESATYYTCDFSDEYVHINADYRS